jgi:uncharacterized protein
MQYNVAQLLKEPIGSSRVYSLDETFSDREGLVDRVAGRVHLMRTHQGILATADLDIVALLTCGRCLAEHPRNLWLSIEEEFYPVVDINTGRRVSAPPGSEGCRIDQAHTLELSEVLRQYIITNSPMKPLCRSDCAGLCQSCGADLNRQQCRCSLAGRDPRWGQLAGLLEPGV